MRRVFGTVCRVEIEHAFVQRDGREKREHVRIRLGSFRIEEIDSWLLCEITNDGRLGRGDQHRGIELMPEQQRSGRQIGVGQSRVRLGDSVRAEQLHRQEVRAAATRTHGHTLSFEVVEPVHRRILRREDPHRFEEQAAERPQLRAIVLGRAAALDESQRDVTTLEQFEVLDRPRGWHDLERDSVSGQQTRVLLREGIVGSVFRAGGYLEGRRRRRANVAIGDQEADRDNQRERAPNLEHLPGGHRAMIRH